MSSRNFGATSKPKQYRTKSNLIKNWRKVKDNVKNKQRQINDQETVINDLNNYLKDIPEEEMVSVEAKLEVAKKALTVFNTAKLELEKVKRAHWNNLNRQEQSKIRRHDSVS